MENKNFGVENLVGPAFEDLSMEEMVAMQGSGDVQADTTPTIASLLISSYTLISAISAYSATHR